MFNTICAIKGTIEGFTGALDVIRVNVELRASQRSCKDRGAAYGPPQFK